MDYIIDNHTDCIGCGKDGFIFRGFQREEDGSITAPLALDLRTEGWVGLPHGGFGMGAISELACGLSNYPKNEKDLFPLTMSFRMGGAGVSTGDTVTVTVSEKDDGAVGVISTKQDTIPYITGDITYKKDDPKGRKTALSYLPDNYNTIKDDLVSLPYYQQCFVCGVNREEPGLRRKFYVHDGPKPQLVVVPVGFDTSDKDSFGHFLRDGNYHPISFLGTGDECMGWGTFFMAKSGGVSVRLSYTFYREVSKDERIVFFGRGDKVRGDRDRRLLFWATGGAAAVKGDGSFDLVMTSSGQWMGMPGLTQQMDEHFHPSEWLTRAYEMAGTGE
ncbi:MAG: hypothetical protein JW885_07155 [Deltaproteobacteria bacterium]|nr:hypothetical protein [Candidatus Zymogenaceae bacterium]